jgi:hypothetical protein
MQPCYSDLLALEKFLQMLGEFPTLSAKNRPKSGDYSDTVYRHVKAM